MASYPTRDGASHAAVVVSMLGLVPHLEAEAAEMIGVPAPQLHGGGCCCLVAFGGSKKRVVGCAFQAAGTQARGPVVRVLPGNGGLEDRLKRAMTKHSAAAETHALNKRQRDNGAVISDC